MKYEYLRKRHSIEAKKDLQKFIDYLSADPRVKWHFDNDCKWPYIKTPAEVGWCGHVQNFFYFTLRRAFRPIADNCRALSFYKKDGNGHVVTWYDGIIIDTFFNILIYKGKRLSLSTTPVVDRHYSWKDSYTCNTVKWSFAKVTFNFDKKIEKVFPPFIEK